jgi:VWFA-related protein
LKYQAPRLRIIESFIAQNILRIKQLRGAEMKTKRTKYFFFIMIFAFSLAYGLNISNSESLQQKKEELALQHEVTVVLKLVQVFVVDENGNPVTDLTIDDFILYDNKELKTITDFEKHLLFRPAEKVDERAKEAERPAPERAPLKSSRMNRKFFLILDLQRNSPKGVKASKEAALHFLDTQIQPSDEVGILSFSQITGLDLHQYLTTDHQKVREAIKGLKGEIPGGGGGSGGVSPLHREQAQAEKEAGLGQEGGIISQIPQLIQPVIDPGWSYAERRSVDFTAEMREMAKALRYIPGYKNIIFFSAGFARSMFRDERTLFFEGFEEMGKELATSSCPVYTINALGETSHFGGREGSGEYSLKLLSEMSGGKYFEDASHYETIAQEIQNITSNYYVLGYYIDEKWDGEFHKIEVQVKREGCKVYAQGGFYNPKPFTELSDFEKQLHLIDLALSEEPYFQQPVRIPLLALPYSDRKKSNLVLLSELNLDEIQELIKQKTEMITLIINNENMIADSSQGEINFSKIPQKTIYHYSISSLSPGEYQCHLVIRNLNTGKGAVGSTSVIIPEPIDSGLKLYPPLILIPEKEGFYLRASKVMEEEIQTEPVSLINIYPYLSNQYSPLVQNLEQGKDRLLGILRCSVRDIEEPNVEISIYLNQQSTEQKDLLPFSIISSEREEEADILLLEIELPELEPGDYSLEFTAREATTGLESQVTQAFRVK